MTVETVGFVLSGGAILACLAYLVASGEVTSFIRVRCEARCRAIDAKLRFLRSPLRARSLLAAEALGGGLLAIGLWFELWILAGFGGLLVAGPSLFLKHGRERRLKQIHLQVEPFLNAMARALSAAPSLGEAIISAIQTLRGGLADELNEVLEEFRLGTPLEVGLERMALRVPSENVRVAVLTLKLGVKSGGRLEPVLSSTAHAMREMERLEGVLRSKTAEGKIQVFVIACLPPGVTAILNWIDPGFFAPLDASFAGHVLVAVAVLFWAAGVLLARHITAVDL